MRDVVNPWANPVTYGVPFFLLAIAIELAALKWLDRGDGSALPRGDAPPSTPRKTGYAGYKGKDATTSLLMGAGSLISISAVKAAGFAVYIVLYAHVAPWHLSMRTWWAWALALTGVDLAYYWYHRFTHRVRVGWAAHQAHHSSEYMNFGTALRQKWNPWFDFFFWRCRCSGCRPGLCTSATGSTWCTSSSCTPSWSRSCPARSSSSSTRRPTTGCTTARTPSTWTATTAES
jgi:hypothetical protein